MAEHLRNELARASIAIRPNRIQTLAKFIEPFTPFAEASDALVHLLVARYGPQSEFPSYHRAIAGVLAEMPELSPELAGIAREIEDQLAERGVALREKRLEAAEPIARGPIIVDGFFTFSPAELGVFEKLADQTSVTVTLPVWPGSVSARERLLHAGFAERHLATPLRQPKTTVRAAATLEQEVEHVASAILKNVAAGREFREMGVLLRVRDPYASALESVFARLGIPARFHFTDPLAAHPAIQYLTGIVRALLNGWNHDDLLTLLRMPVSGTGATPAGDRLDFAIRQNLPDRGLQSLDRISEMCGGAHLSGRLTQLLELSRDRRTPIEWAASLRVLRNLVPAPEITDQAEQTQLHIWRSTAAALNALDETLDTVALALNQEPMSLERFWTNVEKAVSIQKLRIQDRRRNVVNVIDVYEARQWELPIVFVCGLNERQFPQYHRDNPLLPNQARTLERQQEEHFLFELATKRATEETILSYARFNEKGEPQLRSFFIETDGEACDPTRLIPASRPSIEENLDQPAPDLRTYHARLSPTSIESFLQCPFQFFARKTLKLRKAPEKPRDRLNALVQGSVLHRALAEGNLNRVFEDECQKNHIPRTYRTEAVRLELQRHFEAFQSNENWPLNWPSAVEQNFEISLTPELSIRGRIDRLDMGPDNQAIVIDYKYSAAAKIRERIEGDRIQAGLYLLAAERFFHRHPAGMFYCGLRQSVTWEGWHTNIPGMQLGEARASLKELIDTAEQKTLEVYESIAAGNISVRPTDRDKCRYCDYNSICRVESVARTSTANAT